MKKTSEMRVICNNTAVVQCKPYLHENRMTEGGGNDRRIAFGGESYVAAVMGIPLSAEEKCGVKVDRS